MHVPVLQSGWVQRVQHPVCGEPCAGKPSRAGKGSGADPRVWTTAHPATQFSPGGPQPLQTNGGATHWPEGVCVWREWWWLLNVILTSDSDVSLNSNLFVNIIPQTRYPTLENPESLRKSTDDFLTQAAMTDAGLLFPPSQIALAAVLNSASRAGLNLER